MVKKLNCVREVDIEGRLTGVLEGKEAESEDVQLVHDGINETQISDDGNRQNICT